MGLHGDIPYGEYLLQRGDYTRPRTNLLFNHNLYTDTVIRELSRNDDVVYIAAAASFGSFARARQHKVQRVHGVPAVHQRCMCKYGMAVWMGMLEAMWVR